jgi:GMP synthase-like glutamine amidotransferase
MIKIHVLQHEPFEGPGLLADWANEKGHTLNITEVYNNDPLPAIDSLDWLVIMGGGMSVNDEDFLTWLKPEKQFVKAAIDADKIVVGFCLGSQMIANVLGKKVYENKLKEIGWYPIKLATQGDDLQFLTREWNGQVFFHWHGETFDLPDNAKHLAYTTGCTNQAFSIGNRIFGLQFHPETSYQTLLQMVQAGAEELIEDKYVMQADEILALHNYIKATKPLFYGFLDKIAQQAL